jgi:hypothetical protein
MVTKIISFMFFGMIGLVFVLPLAVILRILTKAK